MSERSLTFLTNSPYANALDHHQSIANKFLEILSVKTDGNKTTIVVSTTSGGTSGSQRYPYGKGEFELTGEAGYWRITSYSDSNWVYKEPPQAP